MGVQPTNIPQIDFRNPTAIMSQPGTPGGSNWYPGKEAAEKRKAKFGQGKNPNAPDYNKFYDQSNPENYRANGYGPSIWRGAPSAGYGYNGAGRDGDEFALGGKGAYGTTTQRPRGWAYNSPVNSSGGSNGAFIPTPSQRPTFGPQSSNAVQRPILSPNTPVSRPNPLYNMPQTQTKPEYSMYQNSLNRPYNMLGTRPTGMSETRPTLANETGFFTQALNSKKPPSYHLNGYGTKEGYPGMNPSLEAADAAIRANPVYWQ